MMGRKKTIGRISPFSSFPSTLALPLTALLALRSVHINRRLRNDRGLDSHRNDTDMRTTLKIKKICFSPKVSIQPCRPKSDSALPGAI